LLQKVVVGLPADDLETILIEWRHRRTMRLQPDIEVPLSLEDRQDGKDNQFSLVGDPFGTARRNRQRSLPRPQSAGRTRLETYWNAASA
jgi:hypothetical protein